MKKYIKFLILIILIILIVVAVMFYTKNGISRKEISLMIEPKTTNNMYFKIERYYENQNVPDSIIEMYLKDNKLYKRETLKSEIYEENLYDFQNKTETDIGHKSKNINILPLDDESMNPLSVQLNAISERISYSEDKYKYYGKEDVNGKECIKFSLSYDTGEKFYYLDVENKCIIKTEDYNNQNIVAKELFTYSYDTVTDNDILVFDINNYPDYVFNNTLDNE